MNIKRLSAPLFLCLLLCCGCAAPASPGHAEEAPGTGNSAPADGRTPAAPSEASGPQGAPSEGVPGEAPVSEPADSDFVKVTDYIPTIQVELAYAGTDNFTGQAIYDFTEAYLRYGTAKKLVAVQEALKAQGLGLLIWDAFRPTAAQFKLWEVCPDPTYVANPETGFSSHSRGNTVDVTLVSLDGTAVEMPTGFDDFSPLADRDYSDVDALPAANAALLEDAMTQAGFTPYQGEWWHFSDSDVYEVETGFSP